MIFNKNFPKVYKKIFIEGYENMNICFRTLLRLSISRTAKFRMLFTAFACAAVSRTECSNIMA